MSNQQIKRLIRVKDVQNITGVSKSSIYDLMKRGLFPKQIKLSGGKSVAWLELDIVRWIDQQISASHGDAFEAGTLIV